MTFETVYHFLSSFLTAYFISHYFHFQNSKKYIVLTASCLFILTSLMSLYKYYGLFLSIICWLCVLLSIFIYEKKITLEHIFINLLYHVFIIVNTSIWSLLKEYFIILNVRNYYLFFIFILQFIETCILLKVKDILSLSLDILKWKTVGIFEMILIFFVYFFGYMSLLREISYSVLTFCIVLLLILCIMFMHIIYLINIENAEKIKLIKEKEQERFNRQKYYALSSIKNEIEDTEHRLFYIIFKIEELLKNKEYEEIQVLLDYYKNVILKHKIMIDTKNNIFDVLYSVKINELKRTDVMVNSCIFISVNKFYDDLSFIAFLNNILDCYRKCRTVNINISENNGYVVLRLVSIDGEIDIQEISHVLESNKQDLDYIYSYKNYETKGLRITFDMGLSDE